MMQRAQPSCFFYEWTYDVFLNFRGEDTRTGFTGNLYNSLCQRGIHTFIDDQGLKRGEEITPSLFKAIKESRMAIIVFSENYASSAYCLDELVHILECLKEEGRLVWPVFFDVDPSHVRHQKGNYGKALARHEERFSKEKVQKWRLALSEAANLAGWQLKHGKEYEYEFIGRITDEVSTKINRTPLPVTNYSVGLKSRVLEVNSLLDVGSNDFGSMVGIYGIGGIGKTTIARALFNLIGDQFEGLCFLSNVREISNKHGLLYLQKTLLREIVGEKDIKSGDVNQVVSIIRHRLHQKKVLLVLDDVDEQQQLQAIAGGCDWFGCGSRIIITTRDKHLLAMHGVERMYAVKGLNNKESIQLFSWNAFREKQVPSSYLGISKWVVRYCSGLPLALEVIGSNFYGKGIDEWNSALDGYKRAPHTKIFRVLKLSYDTLEDIEKEIFLDVACFFKGDTSGHVKDMLLWVRDIKSEYAIQVLIDKSLIKIEDGHVTMHDLVQDMGKEIIRQESPKEPGGRSRLWFYEDILHVLQEDMGTDKIEAIMLDLPKGKEVQWSGKAFKKMKNLRMLIVRNACFTRCLTHLPNSLRVLDWSHYPWKALPCDFFPRNLVSLNLTNSSCLLLKPLTKNFESLSAINFRDSKFLMQVPDLSGVPNLKVLYLDDCPSLIEIHDSVGFLSNLRVLSAERCTNLRTLPHGVKLTSLECFRLSWCSSLQSFPEVLEKMEKTTELSLRGTAIEELPYSIYNLTGLQMLDLIECKCLKQLPTSVLTLPKLFILGAKLCRAFRHFSKCKGEEGEGMRSVVSSEMKFLSFFKCNLSDESLSICLSCFPNLTYLDLSFNSFTTLPACIKECHLLRDLSVEYCKQLCLIEGMPPNLETFKAKNCTSLTSLSSDMLLNQAFHGPGRREFILPGQRVPKWFHYCNDGESMCFWVRKEFPALVVCVVVGVLDDTDCTFNLKLSVRINGTDKMFYIDQGLMSTLVTDHLFLFDLPSKKLQKLLLQDQWNHVEVLCMNDSWIRLKGGVIKWSGFYVHKQENSMENIQFSRPCSPKRTCHDLYDFNNDLALVGHPLMEKECTSLDMGVYDCESLDIQQRGFAFIPTGHKHNGKNLLVNNDGSEWLSVGPCWQEPSLYRVNWDSDSVEPASTSDTISDQDGTVLGHPPKSQPENEVMRFPMLSNIQAPTASASSGKVIGGELHQTTYSTMMPSAIDDSSNNDLALVCHPLMEKQHTSLDTGVYDCQSLDIQQRGLAFIPTGHKHNGKNLLVNNDGSKWLSMRPCWEEPSLYCVNWDSNSVEPASTSDTINGQDGTVLDHLPKSQPENEVTRFPMLSNIQAPTASASTGKVIGGELHQTTYSTLMPTAIDDSSINQIEPTLEDVEMGTFFASLDGDLTLVSPSEDTQRALERLQDFLSKDFSDLLCQEQYSTMEATLQYLSNLSPDEGVSGEMKSVILELSREFTHWSWDYGDASRKIELTNASMLKADELDQRLVVIKNHFREFERKKKELCNKLVHLEKRKKELEEQTNAISHNISVSQSDKEMAAKRMREIYEEGKMLKAQRDELRQQVPRLRDEQESAKKIQGKIKAEWSKLAEKFTSHAVRSEK